MKERDLMVEHNANHPLLDRLRGKAFIPGVHYATQAQEWMREAADEIERLQESCRVQGSLVAELQDMASSPLSSRNARIKLYIRPLLSRHGFPERRVT